MYSSLGCEFAAELHDFLVQDLKKYYPKLFGDVQVLLLQSGDSILTQFDRTLQEKALENFRQSNIQVITKARVTGVSISLDGSNDSENLVAKRLHLRIFDW